METRINIAEILKNKPVEIKLYSSTFGYIKFNGVHKDKVYFSSEDTNVHSVKPNGKMYDGGECIIFPSKEMRDWSKFAWKRGDVLISDCGFVCIFKEFASDDYTRFNGCYFDGMPNAQTAKYRKLDNNTAYGYIRELEKRCGGKLNLETLKIEKHPEFKNGDVVFVRCKRFCYIEIFNYFKDDKLYDYASLSTTLQMIDICGKYPISKDEIVEIRIATDSEKKQLFEALANENKVWNAEKKQVVDLKIKWWTPKPFDRVITRNTYDDIWTANIFSHMNSYGEYVAIGCVGGYHYCLPYNEETAHLIGTTDEWKVGEG